MLPLKGRCPDESVVVLARPALRNPATTDMNDVSKAILLVMDLLLEEDETVAIKGVELVLDAGPMTWQHASQMNPTVIKKAATIMQVTERSVFLNEGEKNVAYCIKLKLTHMS